MDENETIFCTMLAKSLDKNLYQKINDINDSTLTNETIKNHKTLMLLDLNNRLQEAMKPYLNQDKNLDEEWDKLVNNPANKLNTIPKMV